MKNKDYLLNITVGILIGFGMGLLFAPEKGSETREFLKKILKQKI